MNCRCYQIILWVTHFYTNQERCGTYHWGIGVWATLDKTSYYLLFKQEVAALPVTSTFSSLSHSSTRIFFSNIFFILRINYKIIIRINDNNSVFSNSFGRLHLILLFKIPMGTWKDFFDIYWQFGHSSSKIFASPALGCMALNIGMIYKGAYVWPYTRLWHSYAINLEGWGKMRKSCLTLTCTTIKRTKHITLGFE